MAHPMSVRIFIYRLEEPLRKRGDDRVAKKKKKHEKATRCKNGWRKKQRPGRKKESSKLKKQREQPREAARRTRGSEGEEGPRSMVVSYGMEGRWKTQAKPDGSPPAAE